MKFHFNNDTGNSGFGTFAFANFSKLIDLDLTNTDFASCAADDFIWF